LVGDSNIALRDVAHVMSKFSRAATAVLNETFSGI